MYDVSIMYEYMTCKYLVGREFNYQTSGCGYRSVNGRSLGVRASLIIIVTVTRGKLSLERFHRVHLSRYVPGHVPDGA